MPACTGKKEESNFEELRETTVVCGRRWRGKRVTKSSMHSTHFHFFVRETPIEKTPSKHASTLFDTPRRVHTPLHWSHDAKSFCPSARLSSVRCAQRPSLTILKGGFEKGPSFAVQRNSMHRLHCRDQRSQVWVHSYNQEKHQSQQGR